MKSIEKIMGRIIRCVEYTALLLLMMLACLTVVGVIFRYVFNNPITWADEVSRYIFVWCTFFGATLVLRKNEHLSINFILNKFPGKIQQMISTYLVFAMCLFLVIIVVGGFIIANMNRIQISPAAGIPMSIPYLAVPANGLLMLMVLAEKWVKNVRKD